MTPRRSPRDRSVRKWGLAKDLEELERTNPAVRAAAEKLEQVKREIIARERAAKQEKTR